MDLEQITSLANMLVEAHGDQAQAAAARRQAKEERVGNRSEVENWKRIRAVIAEVQASPTT